MPKGPKKSKLFLRHDIDVSLKKALRMAEIEKDFGIYATYMVMTKSPLYCVADATSRDILQRIANMDHEIGLHIDLRGPIKFGSIEARINFACKQLENTIDSRVFSVSFHHPGKHLQRGPLMMCGRVNAHARELMDWCLHDSKGCWREGEPLPRLLKPDKTLLQLLIHPIWWGDKHMHACLLKNVYELLFARKLEESHQISSKSFVIVLQR